MKMLDQEEVDTLFGVSDSEERQEQGRMETSINETLDYLFNVFTYEKDIESDDSK